LAASEAAPNPALPPPITTKSNSVVIFSANLIADSR
jgi:hypothetical protein